MKHLQLQQGSVEWLEARTRVVTASELDCLITPKGDLRTGEMPKTYLARKLAEWWIGGPLQDFGGGVREQGSLLEEEARAGLAIELDREIKTAGLLMNDAETIGASPDGLFDDDTGEGVEIKCPQPVNHVKWLLAGTLPDEHRLQCQGAMFVTGAKRWWFHSYSRSMPTILIPVDRDERLQGVIGQAVEVFTERFADAKKVLIARNGGREPDRSQAQPSEWQQRLDEEGDPTVITALWARGGVQ